MTSLDFDIIFAGGGTTACVVAGRLAAADPSLKILVIEGGQHSRDVAHHVQPCRFVENLAPTSTTVTFHVAKQSPYLNGRAAVVPCGRSVGGGSTVNFMAYVRGAASDYDDWKALGNEGWGFKELLPLIRKLENFTPIRGAETHGYTGPIEISVGGADLGIGRQFLDVARAYDPVRPVVDDVNDFKTANAYSLSHKYIHPVTGRRSDTASAYLYAQSANLNVTIMVEKRVKRVIIEHGRAVGVEYISGKGSDGKLVTAKAKKLVVVSAGAFGSPSILERSGIGSPAVLEKNGIPVLVDLPGVGENYQDHTGTCSAFYASDETESMDEVWVDPIQATAGLLDEWEGNGKGRIAHNGIEALMKVRPTAAQLESYGTELQARWETFFKPNPDKPMILIGPFAGFPLDPGHSMRVGRKAFSMIYCILYPELGGYAHVTSGDDPNSPLDFDPRYCTRPSDVAQLNMSYKMMRERARRMAAYRGEVVEYHPKFLPGSPAACKERDVPAAAGAPDIVYSDADNEAIDKYCRDMASTTWHSLGTCAMKPRNQRGVVDARLNVYGVEGLKVADLSICPINVGNNTYSTALLVGEKAAAIIADELGLILQ